MQYFSQTSNCFRSNHELICNVTTMDTYYNFHNLWFNNDMRKVTLSMISKVIEFESSHAFIDPFFNKSQHINGFVSMRE
jgi:hypothetical protein